MKQSAIYQWICSIGSITQIIDLSNNEGEVKDKFCNSHLFMKTLYYSLGVFISCFWDILTPEVVLNEGTLIHFLTKLILNTST
jgi:hypothetical protein